MLFGFGNFRFWKLSVSETFGFGNFRFRKLSVSVCISVLVSLNLSVVAEISVQNRTRNRNLITYSNHKLSIKYCGFFFKQIILFFNNRFLILNGPGSNSQTLSSSNYSVLATYISVPCLTNKMFYQTVISVSVSVSVQIQVSVDH